MSRNKDKEHATDALFIKVHENDNVAIIVNNPNGSSSEIVKKMEEFLLEVAK